MVANGVEYEIGCPHLRYWIRATLGHQATHRTLNPRPRRSLIVRSLGKKVANRRPLLGLPNWFYLGAGQRGASFDCTSIAEPSAWSSRGSSAKRWNGALRLSNRQPKRR